MKRTLSVIESEIKANIIAYNEAIDNGDFTAMSEADRKQSELEKEYAELAEKVCYGNLKAQENPMLAAIMAYGFNIIGHKDVKTIEKVVEDGEEKSITITTREATVKEKQIDLIKFDNYGGKTVSVNPSWKYEIQSLNQLFCIRTAQDMGVPFEPVSYFMDKMARRIEDGETPVSNTAMLEALQNLVDMVIFEGEDKNKYRANSRDITAILKQYTKSGKARLGIAVAKHNYFARIIGKVLYRIVTGEQYTLEYKTSKDA
jgi:hypothetical protein